MCSLFSLFSSPYLASCFLREEAQLRLKTRKLVPSKSIATRLALADYQDREMVAWCAAHGVAYTSYSTLGGQWEHQQIDGGAHRCGQGPVVWQRHTLPSPHLPPHCFFGGLCSHTPMVLFIPCVVNALPRCHPPPHPTPPRTGACET